MPLNPSIYTGYLHLGVFLFFSKFLHFPLHFISPSFSVTGSFYNDVLSNKSLLVIMALSVLSDSCRGPALQEEARISPEMGISKKIPLSALPVRAAFAFPDQ